MIFFHPNHPQGVLLKGKELEIHHKFSTSFCTVNQKKLEKKINATLGQKPSNEIEPANSLAWDELQACTNANTPSDIFDAHVQNDLQEA